MQRRRMSQIAVWTVCAVAIATWACGGKKPVEEQIPESTTTDFRTNERNTVEGTEIPERVEELASVYFDFDRYMIRDDAKPILKRNAQAILDHPDWAQITLEGHCDERGSEEYNLALGERRANAAKRYLVTLGVPTARITTVSFGESMPAVQGHDEKAWHWNRRVELRVSR